MIPKLGGYQDNKYKNEPEQSLHEIRGFKYRTFLLLYMSVIPLRTIVFKLRLW
jgi:hypothetical protein